MPAFVKHEDSWSKAKQIVKKQYPDKTGSAFWRLVTTVYKKMHPEDMKKTANCINAMRKIAAGNSWLDEIKRKQRERILSDDFAAVGLHQETPASTALIEPPADETPVDMSTAQEQPPAVNTTATTYPRIERTGDSETSNDYTMHLGDKSYAFNKNNIGITRNIEKNKEFFDSALKAGKINVDRAINLATGDDNYTAKRDAHYKSIPKNDLNKVFKYTPVSNTRDAHITTKDELGATYAPADNLITAGTAPDHIAALTKDAPINTDEQTLATIGSGTDRGNTRDSLYHEVLHADAALPTAAAGGKASIQSSVNDVAARLNGVDDATLEALNADNVGVKNDYALLHPEREQAIKRNSQALYAAQKLIQEHPELFSQFDPALMREFMSLEPMAKTKEAFQKRLDFLSQHPEFSGLLGTEGMRVIPMYQELKNTPKLKDQFDDFNSMYFLAENKSPVDSNNRYNWASPFINA